MKSTINTPVHLKWLAFSIPPVLVILAIWFPFGFNLTGLIEEWGLLEGFSQNKFLFIASPNGPLAAHALRPLTVLPHSIAYFLDPDSFNYWHILLIATLVIKAISSSTLFWQATGSLRFAMITGLLVLVYPADTMQLSFRGLHINLALSLLLLASTLLITACRSHKPVITNTLGLLSALLLWAALSMYEAGLALVFLPFLITYVREGFRGNIRLWYANKLLVAFWIASNVLYLAYFMVINSTYGHSYQQSIVGDQSKLAILYANYFKLFNPGMIRSLLGGWFDAVRITVKEIGALGYLYLFFAATLIFGSIHYFLRKEKEDKSTSIALIGRLVGVGLLLSLLGYAPYLLSGAHIAISQRTYLFATPGAALVWTALFMTLAQWKKIPSLLLPILFISLGLAAQLFQFHHYVQISETQRSLLRNIIANFKSKPDNSLILLDESQQLGHTWTFLNVYLKAALTYFYGHPFPNIEVCTMPGKQWRLTDSMGLSGSCIETKNQWIFRTAPAVSGPGYTPPPPINKIILKENTTVLKIRPDGSIAPDASLATYRQNLLHGKQQLAKRYQNILISPAWTNHFNKLWSSNSFEKYRWSFGNWWSMELPIRGSGWREAEWHAGRFFHFAYAWKSQENSTLIFNLLPSKKTYLLRGKFDIIINDSILESIQIFINEHPIPYQWLANGKFEAQIPFDQLLSGSNTITFHAKTDPTYYGLSAQLAWFEVFPLEG